MELEDSKGAPVRGHHKVGFENITLTNSKDVEDVQELHNAATKKLEEVREEADTASLDSYQ